MEQTTIPKIDKDIFTAKRPSKWSPELVEQRFEEMFITLMLPESPLSSVLPVQHDD